MELLQNPEVPEYLFRTGVEEAVARIRKLFLSQDHVLASVAGPMGNEVNVGKTHFSGAILRTCVVEGIPFVSVSGLDGVDKRMGPSIQMQKEVRGSDKCLILLKAMGSFAGDDPTHRREYREREEFFLRQKAKPLDLPFEKIDLRVLVCRSDQPIRPANRLSVDLVVRNEFAKDKGI